MSQQGRNKAGKFAPKSDKVRQVRSIRLTDNTWDALGEISDERSITRADLIEEWFIDGSFSLGNKVKELETELEKLKTNSLYVSDLVIDSLDKIANERSITREELILSLLNNSFINKKDENECSINKTRFAQMLKVNVEVIKEYGVDKIQPNFESGLHQSGLAKRFGIDSSSLRNQRLRGEEKFLLYSFSKDRDKIAWRYSEDKKFYYPAFQQIIPKDELE